MLKIRNRLHCQPIPLISQSIAAGLVVCVVFYADCRRALEDILAGVLMGQREGQCQLIVDFEVDLDEVVQPMGEVDALEELAFQVLLEG